MSKETPFSGIDRSTSDEVVTGDGQALTLESFKQLLADYYATQPARDRAWREQIAFEERWIKSELDKLR